MADRRPIEKLGAAAARRIALAAQGFAEARPEGPVTRRHVRRTIDRLGLLQIDSVNVLVRSHYLPLFARLGSYPLAHLDEEAWGRKRTLFEYWGHEASLMPMALQPMMRWRMERAARGEGIYGGLAKFARERKDFVEAVLKEVEVRGGMGAGDLEIGGRGEGGWWGWSEGKKALEFLFWAGRITTATRRSFERIYDLTERALPRDVVETPTPPEDVAQRHLLTIAARALGVATERDIRDYFRLDVEDTKLRLAELVEEGALVPVSVEGWKQPAFLDPQVRHPRRVKAGALLSPFDSLVWERDRAERLFGFRYRLEIYTPAEKRVHGYYVLPVLHGDRLIGRVDLKADRAAGVLRVNAAHGEAIDHDPEALAEVGQELIAMAGWLGLGEVAVAERGDLSRHLADAVRGAT